jgi:hypothetical protein
MIPHRPKQPLAQRLWREMSTQLAAHARCCPVHGTPLICCRCDVVWTGSAGEHCEVEALVARSALYDLTWPTWPCDRCDGEETALCVECYAPVRGQALVGLTPAEAARCVALLRTHLRVTGLPDPEAADRGEQSYEGEGIS